LTIRTLIRAEVEELYEKHGAALAAYLCCGGLDFASAEDVVQQVFLKLLKGHIPTPDSVPAYLYRSVRSASLNLRRDRSSEVHLDGNEQWLVEAGGHREKVLELDAALRSLPPEQRDAVFLKVWGGLTLQDIATTLEISINTAASRYRYAIDKLRGQLRGDEVKEDASER
jgi:RNA polymerase sigma-70 factor, ECF subfamily